MTEEQKLDLMKKFRELNVADYTTKYGDYYGLMFAGAEIATKELQEENARLKKESEENDEARKIIRLFLSERFNESEWQNIQNKAEAFLKEIGK